MLEHRIDCDVLVIGGGLAGCMAALRAREELGAEARVVLADKGYVSRSGQSPFAAGVFNVFYPEEDDLDEWMEDIVRGGEYLNDQEWCKQFFLLSAPIAGQLDQWAMEAGEDVFLKDERGKLVRRKSRGHKRTWHNVLFPLPMMDACRRLLRLRGVQMVERVMITDLVRDAHGVLAAFGFNYQAGETYVISARAIVAAAGACGFKNLYIGHRMLTGDVQAAAFRIGAEMTGCEHFYSNTVCKDYDIHGMNLFVGVGGRFVNRLGEEFMWDYHPELGNRARLQDLVLAFSREVMEGRGPIYLDIRSASSEDQALLRRVLPETFKVWDRAGKSPFREPLEWVPAMKGTTAGGGGLVIDLTGATNIPGLYAAGEICWMPIHGTYAFGGVNICFAAVSGHVAGIGAARYVRERAPALRRPGRSEVRDLLHHRLAPLTRTQGHHPEAAAQELRKIVIPYNVAYIKTAARIRKAIARVEDLAATLLPKLRAKNEHEMMLAAEVESMATIASVMLRASLLREESRGFHFREEFPLTNNRDWLKHVILWRAPDGEVRHRLRAVETPYVQPDEEFSLPPGVKRRGSRGPAAAAR